MKNHTAIPSNVQFENHIENIRLHAVSEAKKLSSFMRSNTLFNFCAV